MDSQSRDYISYCRDRIPKKRAVKLCAKSQCLFNILETLMNISNFGNSRQNLSNFDANCPKIGALNFDWFSRRWSNIFSTTKIDFERSDSTMQSGLK
jgi:hypothetical protein